MSGYPASAVAQNVAVTLAKSGKLWRGDDFDDLAEYIRHFKAGPANAVSINSFGIR